MRLCQLAGIDPAEIIVSFNNDKNYGQKVNPGKELAVIFWERVKTPIPKTKRIQLIKRTSSILPHIVRETSIS